MIESLIAIYNDRKEKGRIKDTRAIDLIDSYIKGVQKSQLPEHKKLNQYMILKCLIMSGDEMWLEGSAAEFQKAYRSWGVISTPGLASYDSVMWNLMHIDKLIWDCLEENGVI